MTLRTAVSILSRRLSAVVDKNFRGKGVSSEDIKPKLKDTELQSLYEKIRIFPLMLSNFRNCCSYPTCCGIPSFTHYLYYACPLQERVRKQSQKGVKDIFKRPVIASLGGGFVSHFWFKYKRGEDYLPAWISK